MKEVTYRAGLLTTAATALFFTLGIILLVYAAISRIAAVDFLAQGEMHEATIASAEARGLRFGGWKVSVRFWDRSGSAASPGRLVITDITDLLPLSGVGEPGKEIQIRWIMESDPPRIAPEASLHESSRPWEQRFSVGAILVAAGVIASLFGEVQRIRALESRPRAHES